MYFQLNGDSGANYSGGGWRTKTAQTEFQTSVGDSSGSISGWPAAASDNNNFAAVQFYDYANTSTYKLISAYSYSYYRTASDMNNNTTRWGNTAAISSIFIAFSGANFSGGTYILYGVS
jgi:hypothetical protein